jgi:DNA replication protein DnaC
MTNALSLTRELEPEGMRRTLVQMQELGDSQLESGLPLLLRLLEAEDSHRRQLKVDTLSRRAHFRYQSGLASIATGESRNLDRALVQRLAEGHWIRQGQNVLITGATGVGKSYLASALGNQACKLGYKTLYFNCAKLWPLLRQARHKERFEKQIAAIARSDLLILDDFGLLKLDGPDRLSFLEILEDRWGRASTLVVSQRPLSSWHEVLGDPPSPMPSATDCSTTPKRSNSRENP